MDDINLRDDIVEGLTDIITLIECSDLNGNHIKLMELLINCKEELSGD
jgi:hypothetical protein